MEVPPFIFKVWKHFVINYTNNYKRTTKMGDIKQKVCYRPSFKPSRDHSKATRKHEIWHTHPENLELLVLKEMKLIASL